jgi:hypothetical protein
MVSTTSVETFLLWLQSQRFTGPVTLHCLDGVPRSAQFGPPSRVDFYDPGPSPPAPSPPSRGAPQRKGLDNPPPQDADSGSGSEP